MRVVYPDIISWFEDKVLQCSQIRYSTKYSFVSCIHGTSYSSWLIIKFFQCFIRSRTGIGFLGCEWVSEWVSECVRVCVCEREREREGESEWVSVCSYICLDSTKIKTYIGRFGGHVFVRDRILFKFTPMVRTHVRAHSHHNQKRISFDFVSPLNLHDLGPHHPGNTGPTI